MVMSGGENGNAGRENQMSFKPISTRFRSKRSYRCWQICLSLSALLIITPAPSAHSQNATGFSFNAEKEIKVAAVRKKRKRYKRRYKRYNKSRQNKLKKTDKWFANTSSKDPLQIVISLSEQQAKIYRGTTAIASSRVSTGKSGYRTPSGIFSIIQKHRRHYSNLYGSAPMPFMQRITWSGVALHAGHLPGYPASHGCIRLPHSFARQLFAHTNMGIHVIVTKNRHDQSQPAEISHPVLFQSNLLVSFIGPKPPSKFELIKSVPTTELLEDDAKGQEGEPSRAQKTETTKATQQAIEWSFQSHSKRSKTPLRILITRLSGPERLKDAQRLLLELGYDTGEPDGLLGRRTSGAIRAFQKETDLPVTGTISEPLVRALYRATGKEKIATGRLYVRQNFHDIFSTEIEIKASEQPLGTHLFTTMSFDKSDSRIKWFVQSIKEAADKTRKDEPSSLEDKNPSTAYEALSRIKMPAPVRWRISEMLTPGSSMIITDNGFGRETGKGTDFIVLTR